MGAVFAVYSFDLLHRGTSREELRISIYILTRIGTRLRPAPNRNNKKTAYVQSIELITFS